VEFGAAVILKLARLGGVNGKESASAFGLENVNPVVL